MYAFIITKDHIDSGKAEGQCCAVGMTITKREFEKHDDARPFRLRDDDGEVYFDGLFVGDADSEEGFAPLDRFGEAYGCTEIQYKEGNRWVTL